MVYAKNKRSPIEGRDEGMGAGKGGVAHPSTGPARHATRMYNKVFSVIRSHKKLNCNKLKDIEYYVLSQVLSSL